MFHWQNLNEKRGGKTGSGIRHGRCWWHLDDENKCHNVIEFSWNLWSHFCGVHVDWDDEDLTLMMAFPPFAFWLSLSSTFAVLKRLLPRRPLQYYPETIVVDEREIGIRVHSGRLWINPYSRKNESHSKDPWWIKGVSFSLNPFELVHMRHEVRGPKQPWGPYEWRPYVGSWERHKGDDGRETMEYPYRYTLRSGVVQERRASVFVERRAWRPRCLRWTSLFERERVSIDVTFNEGVGERSGSWKGGCTGCGWDLLPRETPEGALRRMESQRVFA